MWSYLVRFCSISGKPTSGSGSKPLNSGMYLDCASLENWMVMDTNFIYALKGRTLQLHCVLYNSKIDEVYLDQWCFESSQPRCQTLWMSELSDDFHPSHLYSSERSWAKTCPTEPISNTWPIETVRDNKLLLLFEATKFMGDLVGTNK